ncbi:hypothetical protein B566_EDAN003471 [Ephemera danica]|nr:hypothetical protein B566_EDAN003471 [Ephemera danica]
MECATLMLNKPVGYECSRKPQHHPSVLELLPLPLRERGVQPIGRLDADTTGLLLISDDGQLNHILSSARRKLPKVYLATTRHPLDAGQIARLLAGVMLNDEPQPIAAAAAGIAGENLLRLTLTEGKYHQVKRMVAAAGNRVEALHREAPTLSVALKKVEGQLGAALFERTAANVRITTLGERIVAQARRVLDEAVKLEEIADATGDPMSGQLRVGIIYTIAPYLLPKLIPALHREAPLIPLFLKEDFTGNLIPALKAGELDVIVIALPFAEPGLVAQPAYDEPFRVVVPAAHPWVGRPDVAASELDGENLLLLGQGNCFRDQVLESCPRLTGEDALEHAIEGSSLETIRHMVASGAGVAVMPSTAADPLIGREPLVRVLPFSGESPRRTVGLVWRVTFPRPQAIDAVRAAVLSCQLPGATPVR